MTLISVCTVHARAALAGNPSDLHGGAVLAIPVRAFTAEVGVSNYPRGGRLVGAPKVVSAALARVGADGYRVTWASDIPKRVGLGGSSALVIAALGASRRAPADPLELAQLALSVERDDLGIVSGLQDRAVQAFDEPVLVDLAAAAIVRPITPPAQLRFVIAWLPEAASDSGDYHRERLASRRAVAAGMGELARIARAAADGFEAGDAPALARLMDESASVRRGVASLPPAHEELADAVRAAGLSPNSTGSGGAVVAVVTEDTNLDALDVPYTTQDF